MPLRDGATFAGFAIVRRLGSGGMGDVYLAQHPRLPRLQALRILPPEMSADAEFRARFQREADVVASLSHPNIVGVHDGGESDGQLWILMGYVDGIDAAHLLGERYPQGMPRVEAMQIVGDIAEALDHAHEQGLEHGNVKPGNILITNPGTAHSRILLADLGIARRIDNISKFTAANVGYTAPEQLLDLPYQGRVDQYSLAATAYHLLSGCAPFAHPSPVVVISRHLGAPPPRIGDARPDLADLDAALSRALAKDSRERFPRCHDLADALRGEVRSRPEIASGPVPLAPPAPMNASPPTPAPTSPPTAAAPLHLTPTGPSGAHAQSWPSTSQPQPWWPPPPPPKRRDRRWWIVGAAGVAMAAIIAVVLVVVPAHGGGARPAGAPSTTSSPTAPRGAAASAGDTGPVAIITEDPTCTAWTPIGQTWLASTPIEQWDTTHPGQRNPMLKPGTDWSGDERSVMQATAKSTRVAVAKTEPLIRTTPHRVMRELYEQFVAFGRAYADVIGDKYVPLNSALGGTTESTFNALISICTDVATGAAKTRAPLVPAVDAPPRAAAPQDPDHLQRFATTADLTVCGQLAPIIRQYRENPAVKDWERNDQSGEALLWNPQQKAMADAVAPLMSGVADDIQRAGQGGSNAVLQDFATLYALYQRAVVKALPTYTWSDGEMNGAASYLVEVLKDGCAAIGM